MEQHHRIKLWMGAALVITAFTIDLIEMLLEWLGVGLVLNFVFTPGVTFLFWLWFKLLSVPFIASPKKFFTLAATCLAEIIPALDALGGFFWTLGTIIIVIMVRSEDRGGIVGQLSGTTMNIMKTRYIANKKIFNQPGNPQQIAMDLRKNRPDLVIKKDELITKASNINPEFKKTQYNRALDMINKTVDDKVSPNTLDLKQK